MDGRELAIIIVIQMMGTLISWIIPPLQAGVTGMSGGAEIDEEEPLDVKVKNSLKMLLERFPKK